MLTNCMFFIPIILCILFNGYSFSPLRSFPSSLRHQDVKNSGRGNPRRDDFEKKIQKTIDERRKESRSRAFPTKIISANDAKTYQQNRDEINTMRRGKKGQTAPRNEGLAKRMEHSKITPSKNFKSRIRKNVLKNIRRKTKKERQKSASRKRDQIDDGNSLVITGDDNSDNVIGENTASTDVGGRETTVNQILPNGPQSEEIEETIDDESNNILPYPGGSPPRSEQKPQTGGDTVIIRPGKNQQTDNGIEIENVPTQNTMCNMNACSKTASGRNVEIQVKPSVPSTDITIVLKGMKNDLMMNGFLPILKYWYILYLNALQGKITDSNLGGLGVDLGGVACNSGLMKVFKNGLSAAGKNVAGILKLQNAGSTDTQIEIIGGSSTTASASASASTSVSSSTDDEDASNKFVIKS